MKPLKLSPSTGSKRACRRASRGLDKPSPNEPLPFQVCAALVKETTDGIHRAGKNFLREIHRQFPAQVQVQLLFARQRQVGAGFIRRQRTPFSDWPRPLRVMGQLTTMSVTSSETSFASSAANSSSSDLSSRFGARAFQRTRTTRHKGL